MRSPRSSTWIAWGFGLALACCLSFSGCSDSAAPSGPTQQTEEVKAKQAAAQKATEDAFKEDQKKKKATPAPRQGSRNSS